MSTSGTASNIKVLRALGQDARAESMLAEVAGFTTPMVVRVFKPGVVTDPARFMDRARALSQLSHPGLVVPRRASVLRDGRVMVVCDFVDAESLASRTALPIDQLVTLGTQVAGALGALHAAGLSLGGEVLARDILLAPSALLDVSLAAATPSTTEDADARALATLLLSAGAAGADHGPFESAVRRSIEGVASAAALVQALDDLRSRWQARTAVSGSHPPTTIEGTEPDLTGTLLGQYQLERLIGEGAMGRVYLGRHQRIGRLAAVKVLKIEHAVQADLVQRFIQEAQAVNAIRNEHIVEVYDFGEEPTGGPTPRVFCIMELLEGEALADAMDHGTMPVQRAVRICQQMATALHAAHQVGVVHRDIKPENIFLTKKSAEGDFVKVLDFGVAKLLKPLGDLPRSGTMAGIVIGTPEYMAPEQALGSQTDYRVDLYAVGLVLYEMLCGEQPFHGDTFGKLVVELTTKAPPPLPPKTKSGETIPPGLARLVMRCLEKDPDARWASGEALAKALEPFAYSGRTVLNSPAEQLPDAPSDVQALEAIRPSRVPKVLAGLAALTLLAGAGYVFLVPGPVEPTPPVPQRVVVPVKPLAAPTTVWLEVQSTPAGAAVSRADTAEPLGLTPLKVQLPALPQLTLVLALEGHETVEREVGLSANASVSIDLPAVKKAPEPPRDGPKKPKKKVSRDGVVDPFSQ